MQASRSRFAGSFRARDTIASGFVPENSRGTGFGIGCNRRRLTEAIVESYLGFVTSTGSGQGAGPEPEPGLQLTSGSGPFRRQVFNGLTGRQIGDQ